MVLPRAVGLEIIAIVRRRRQAGANLEPGKAWAEVGDLRLIRGIARDRRIRRRGHVQCHAVARAVGGLCADPEN